MYVCTHNVGIARLAYHLWQRHHAEFCVRGKASSWEHFCMAEQGGEEGEKAEVLSTSEHIVHKSAKKEKCAC